MATKETIDVQHLAVPMVEVVEAWGSNGPYNTLERGDLWSSYASGRNGALHASMGYTAVHDIKEGGAFDECDALRFASHAAIQEPPLLGEELLAFLNGAQQAVTEIHQQNIKGLEG